MIEHTTSRPGSITDLELSEYPVSIKVLLIEEINKGE